MREESDHNLFCAALFPANIPNRDRAEKAFRHIGEQILIRTAIDSDAPTPESPCRSLFTNSQIETHLKSLAAQQQADGGWAILWPAISPAIELEARGIVTLSVMKTLKAFGYL